MALGPGKYDDICTYTQQQSKAAGVVLIIIGGDKGSGYSVRCAPALALKLPDVLRQVADKIQKDNAPLYN